MAALLIDAVPAGAQIAARANDRVNLSLGRPGQFQADTTGHPHREPTTSNPFGRRARLMFDGQVAEHIHPSPIVQRATTVAAHGSVEYSQAPTSQRDRDTPDFKVQVFGDIMVDFSKQIWAYFELRSQLERGLPALRVTDDPAEIQRAVRALAERIRVARADAKEGDIFTPAASTAFRKALHLQMNADSWREIMDDNPGEFSNRINGDYPDKKPVSTVPANVLAVLPRLPDDIQYRFTGRHLILLDTKANVVLDRIPYAIECADDDKLACHR